MILDLNTLPYRLVIDIIKWCFDNDIDREKCMMLIDSVGCNPSATKADDWTLEIPEEYTSWFLLRWS